MTYKYFHLYWGLCFLPYTLPWKVGRNVACTGTIVNISLIQPWMWTFVGGKWSCSQCRSYLAWKADVWYPEALCNNTSCTVAELLCCYAPLILSIKIKHSEVGCVESLFIMCCCSGALLVGSDSGCWASLLFCGCGKPASGALILQRGVWFLASVGLPA